MENKKTPKRISRRLFLVLALLLAVTAGVVLYLLDLPKITVERGDGHLSIIIGTPPAERQPSKELTFVPPSTVLTPEQWELDAALGIVVEDLPPQVKLFYNLPDGVFVTHVEASSPCAQKGLRRGDILTKINGKALCLVEDLKNTRQNLLPGQEVRLTVYRNGQNTETTVKLR